MALDLSNLPGFYIFDYESNVAGRRMSRLSDGTLVFAGPKYNETTFSPDIYLWYSTDEGVNWNTEVIWEYDPLIPQLAVARQPVVAVDSNDRIHLVFSTKYSDDWRLLYISGALGVSYDAPQTLHSSNDTWHVIGSYYAISVGPDDVVHVCFSDWWWDSTEDPKIWHTLVGSGFLQVLQNPVGTLYAPENSPICMHVDADNYVHIAWTENNSTGGGYFPVYSKHLASDYLGTVEVGMLDLTALVDPLNGIIAYPSFRMLLDPIHGGPRLFFYTGWDAGYFDLGKIYTVSYNLLSSTWTSFEMFYEFNQYIELGYPTVDDLGDIYFPCLLRNGADPTTTVIHKYSYDVGLDEYVWTIDNIGVSSIQYWNMELMFSPLPLFINSDSGYAGLVYSSEPTDSDIYYCYSFSTDAVAPPTTDQISVYYEDVDLGPVGSAVIFIPPTTDPHVYRLVGLHNDSLSDLSGLEVSALTSIGLAEVALGDENDTEVEARSYIYGPAIIAPPLESLDMVYVWVKYTQRPVPLKGANIIQLSFLAY